MLTYKAIVPASSFAKGQRIYPVKANGMVELPEDFAFELMAIGQIDPVPVAIKAAEEKAPDGSDNTRQRKARG